MYTMFYFSMEHSFWNFDAANRDKVLVVAFGIVANVLIVGSLKERMEKTNKERLHQLEIATTLNRCAAELSADRNTHAAIYNLLGIICDYFQADRSYIFDIDYEKQIVSNFIGVDNPQAHFDDATLLESLQYFIVNSQSSKRQQDCLQFLSFRDMLTGLYNRNKYIKVLESCEHFPVRDTGTAYIDLNGLKQINDNLGHEAGDRLICNAAKCILKTFPEDSYRIGGDEFVIIVPETGEEDFKDQIDRVRKDLEDADVSFSMGLEWKKEGMLEAMLKAAKKRMYLEKNAYYREKGRDRRCLVKA